ncbi:MAG: hypothetical protein KBT39_00095 [Bacteroidales bacterium]|nr:hypothetical protein [Bacteroidales bacterium]
MKRHIIYIYTLLAIALFAACTSDDFDQKAEGEMTHVSMTIGTRAATGVPETTTIEDELIHSWWVVFVNKAGNVQKIVDRPVGLTTYVEEEKVELDIPVGTYTLYAFANITPSASSAGSVTIAGLTFTEGAASPTATDIEAKTFALTNGHTGSIPMTGKQSIAVTGRANQTFSIEVVRMLAKMEMQYSNKSKADIQINSLAITQVQPTPVSLLPNYTWLDSGWPFADLSTAATTYTRSYNGSPLPVISLDAKGGSKPSATDIFYMMESQADYATPSQSYLMTLNVTRNGATDNLYFTLDKTKIQTIYRNDHVIVPLTITDFIVGLDAHFYPPIGGYPAVITKDKDKDEFYVTFKTQGDFEIMPTVYNASTRTNVYYPKWDYNSTTVTVTGDPIFTTAPHIDTTTGELLGKLSTNEGTAVIDVEIKVEVSSGVYQVYPRRIYIVRKN